MLRNIKKTLTLLLIGALFTSCGTSGDEKEIDTSLEVLSFGGNTYKRITSPVTKEVWLDRNLGASQVCTSLNDESCFGDYYQWGRLNDGHEKKDSLLIATRATSISNAGDKFITDGTNSVDWTNADDTGVLRQAQWNKNNGKGICPSDYRVPTFAELEAEMNSSGIKNNTHAFNSFLKLPSAGWRSNFDGDILDKGDWGYLWSTDNAGTGFLAKSLGYSENEIGESITHVILGYNVRCIKDKETTATTTNQTCLMTGTWDIAGSNIETTFSSTNQTETLPFPKATVTLEDKGNTVESNAVLTSFKAPQASAYIYSWNGEKMVYQEKDTQSGCKQTITETWTVSDCKAAGISVINENKCPNGLGDSITSIITSASKQ